MFHHKTIAFQQRYHFSMTMFHHENQKQHHNCTKQANYALHRPRALLTPLRLLQLLNARLGMLHYRLHVIIDPVQYGSLIDNQHRQLLEDGSQFLDALRDLRYFLVPRLNLRLQVVHHRQLLLRHTSSSHSECSTTSPVVVVVVVLVLKRPVILEINTEPRLALHQPPALLRLDIRQIPPLPPSKLARQSLKLHRETPLDVRSHRALLPSRAFGRLSDFLEVSFGHAEERRDLGGPTFDLTFHVVEVAAEYGPDAGGVHGGEFGC
mmetsp:Transcript_5461/g.11967  ORF Transcript_5461/g.11967 Transcript_5461/m.11967 type:complete len:265 (-) Transcript_5461:421-1215(-)